MVCLDRRWWRSAVARSRFRETVIAALRVLSEALDTMLLMQDRPGESEMRSALAATFAASGDRTAAIDQHRQALSLVQQSDARIEQARALLGLAGVLDATDPAASQAYLRQALALYEELGLPDQEEIRKRLRLVGSRAVDPLLGTVGEDLPLPHG